MKYHLHFAIILALNCSMYFLLTRFQFVLYLLNMCWLPPPHTNAAEVTGKIIQEVTTAFVINRVHPYIWLNSKSAWFGQVTSEFWPLITATSKQNPCADIQDSTWLCWSFSIKQTPTFALYSPLNVHLVFLFIGVVCVFCFAVFLLAPFKQRCKRCTFNNTAFALQELTK